MAMGLFTSARTELDVPMLAFEFLTDACLQVVLQHRGMQHPLEQPTNAYVLLEVEGHSSAQVQDALDVWLGKVFEQGLAVDGVIAQSQKDAANLWALREGISESLARTGFLHKNDIALPVKDLVAFVNDMQRLLQTRYADFGVYLFGHMGDGNLHLNMMKPQEMTQDAFLARCYETDRDVFTLIQKHHGSVSAEHGIGLLKKAALHYSRSAQEIELFRAIKKAFDPQGLLNPGKIFD
jgi:FAD/FMN-containing dehydrogenase